MKSFSLILMLSLSIVAIAQKSPDWKIPVEGKPISIFKHNFTGIPVVETSKFYYGVNYVDQSILWSIEKPKSDQAQKAVGDVAAMAGLTDGNDEDSDFEEIPLTPFVNIHNRFIDVSTGKILFGGGDDEFVSISGHDILPDLYKLLVNVTTQKSANVLYCIDLNSKEVEWKQSLYDPQGKIDLKRMTAVSMSSSIFNVFAPKVTANKEIVYKNNNDLILLNSSTGEIIWKNECKPATFFLDDKQETLVVVKQATIATSSSLGKTLFALDLKTGKELWKNPLKLSNSYAMSCNYDSESFIAAHSKGINIYNFKTGEATWKKDYDAKRVQEITVKTEGIEVFYGNKLMLVDATTGKKAWKKPIQFDDVPEDDEGDMIKKDYEKGVFIMGSSFAGLFNKETGKKIWRMSVSPSAKSAFDNKNTKIAILDGKKLYLFNPNDVVKKPQKIKLDINQPEEISGFETLSTGYFITGMNEYIFLDKKSNVVSSNYFKPLKTDRLLKAALVTTSVASGIGGAEWTATDQNGNKVAEGGVFMSKENAKAMQKTSVATADAFYKLKNDAKLKGAVRSGNGYACFLKGEKVDGGDKMSIVKVDKKTGKEVDSFDFGDNRKVIFELDNVANYLYFCSGNSVNVFDLNL